MKKDVDGRIVLTNVRGKMIKITAQRKDIRDLIICTEKCYSS